MVNKLLVEMAPLNHRQVIFQTMPHWNRAALTIVQQWQTKERSGSGIKTYHPPWA
jgi:hypothetical protein